MKKKHPENLEAKFAALLDPLSKSQPCGEDLEYHPDLLVLTARLSPQEQAQYGDFKAPTEQTNWREAQDALMALLARGRDLRALIMLLRCRVQQAGVQGAFEGFYLIAQTLKRFGAEVHPRHTIDGVLDPSVRANVLAELANPQTALADLRGLLVHSASASRLSVRDVERALALPHPSDAMPAESVRLQLSALWRQQHGPLLLLAKVHALVAEISQWVEQDLALDAPNLQPLSALLQPYDEKHLSQASAAAAAQQPVPAPTPSASGGNLEPQAVPSDLAQEGAAPIVQDAPALPAASLVATPATPSLPGPIRSRQDAKEVLHALRQWFEQSEPSSPVADLLHQAEFLIGKPYHEVADAIPLDLLSRWRQSR